MEYPSQIRAVIFDLGGVILRTDDSTPRTSLAQQLKKTRAELEELVFSNHLWIQAERGLSSEEEVWASIAQSANLPVEQMPAFRKEFFGGDQVDFQLIEWIQGLRKRYTTALLSNTGIVDLPRFLRENLQIPETFDVIISSAQVKVAKPDPEIFHIALEMVKARPEEAVFVDDNLLNIEAASALGIRTVRFFNTEQALSDLKNFIQVND